VTVDPTVSGVNAAAHNSDLARRIQLIHDSGHDWADPQTQVALAGSSMPDHALSSSLDAIRGLLNNAKQSYATVFDDPVLHKAPSTSMKVAQWFGDNVGYAPVEQPDVSNIQKQLAAKGFYSGPTDGVWNAESNQAWQDAWYAHVQDQQDNVGQIAPVHKVAHGFLSSLGLSHAIPALVGSVKSIPGGLRSLGADVAGAAAELGSGLTNAAGMHVTSSGQATTSGVDPNQTRARVTAAVENLGNQGKKVTAEDILAHPYARVVNDIGTLLMFVPYGKVGTEVARTLGIDMLRNEAGDVAFRALPASAAYRGPGVVSKAFVTTGDDAGFNLLGRSMENTPGLRQLYPAVRQTFDKDGWYYQTRRALAQPMRNPMINLGVRTAQYTSLLGATDRGIAAVEGRAGDKEHGIAGGVYGEGTISGHWGTILDIAGSLGKATIGSDPSKVVGDIVKGGERLTNAALGGPADIGTSFDTAMRAAGETGFISKLTSKDVSYGTLVSKFGKSDVDDYLNNSVTQMAAAKLADAWMLRDARDTGVTLDGEDKTRAFLALRHEAWNSPELLQQARDELVANPHELFERFFREHNGIVQDLSSSAGSGPGIGGYIEAKRATYRLLKINENLGSPLLTPEAFEGLAAARQTAADDAAWTDGGAPWSSAVGTSRCTWAPLHRRRRRR
jgi:peptidoglycan hydrolase-like protein with peptidoglycan-binding domain